MPLVYNNTMVTLYRQPFSARFIDRPNRFIARVQADGQELVCHVKNTGRCRELLLPGAQVVVAPAGNPLRKTGYGLVAVYKGDMLVNIDSQAPNTIASAWLKERYPSATVRREASFGDSRLDFHVKAPGLSLYVEAKGCTLEEDSLALFPDAPTQRGVKHLKTLMDCQAQGHQAMALFVIQMKPVRAFSPHDAMHPQFGDTLRQAARSGVQVLAYDCRVGMDGMEIDAPVPVIL